MDPETCRDYKTLRELVRTFVPAPGRVEPHGSWTISPQGSNRLPSHFLLLYINLLLVRGSRLGPLESKTSRGLYRLRENKGQTGHSGKVSVFPLSTPLLLVVRVMVFPSTPLLSLRVFTSGSTCPGPGGGTLMPGQSSFLVQIPETRQPRSVRYHRVATSSVQDMRPRPWSQSPVKVFEWPVHG